jgi:peptidoglycan/xylan/chitin deacetylase (PgdA/CDA1 family)
MFNVYENTEIVNSIIDVLSKHGAKCTFFVGGCWADDNENTLKRIVLEGHEIANHGYFHKDHKKLSFEQNRQEIVNTSSIIRALSGAQDQLFAPPSGSFSDTTLEVAAELGYKVIMWSKDTIDWRDKNEDLVFNRATKGLTNGDLILMHPKEHTLSALPKIIKFYLGAGYNLTTVSDNIKE